MNEDNFNLVQEYEKVKRRGMQVKEIVCSCDLVQEGQWSYCCWLSPSVFIQKVKDLNPELRNIQVRTEPECPPGMIYFMSYSNESKGA